MFGLFIFPLTHCNVDPAQGHDDFMMSLALLVRAANQYRSRVGWGIG
ncbi:hypothetical protein ACFLVJ_02900 [Chloroflexota bacterium]